MGALEVDTLRLRSPVLDRLHSERHGVARDLRVGDEESDIAIIVKGESDAHAQIEVRRDDADAIVERIREVSGDSQFGEDDAIDFARDIHKATVAVDKREDDRDGSVGGFWGHVGRAGKLPSLTREVGDDGGFRGTRVVVVLVVVLLVASGEREGAEGHEGHKERFKFHRGKRLKG